VGGDLAVMQAGGVGRSRQLRRPFQDRRRPLSKADFHPAGIQANDFTGGQLRAGGIGVVAVNSARRRRVM